MRRPPAYDPAHPWLTGILTGTTLALTILTMIGATA